MQHLDDVNNRKHREYWCACAPFHAHQDYFRAHCARAQSVRIAHRVHE